jgi:hypothetical protein
MIVETVCPSIACFAGTIAQTRHSRYFIPTTNDGEDYLFEGPTMQGRC